MMNANFRNFLIRDWQPGDRQPAANLIHTVLNEYGLNWQPQGADQDVLEVEQFYQQTGGEFWVIEQQGQIVGTAAYYPIARGEKAVEIRKMYLLPAARGQGLGRFLLLQLEDAISQRGWQTIWIETATILETAVKLYESQGYKPTTGVETQRCDRVYVKRLAVSTHEVSVG
jgi:putative acetyltransferase